MVKCGVLFEVRTDFLNIIWTSFGFKELRQTIRILSFKNVFLRHLEYAHKCIMKLHNC
jgi:hypothetical protein